MTDLFDAVWDIRTHAISCPSREPRAYASVVAAGRLRAAARRRCSTTSPAIWCRPRALGMTTVWLKTDDFARGEHGPLPDVAHGDIDHETRDLPAF